MPRQLIRPKFDRLFFIQLEAALDYLEVIGAGGEVVAADSVDALLTNEAITYDTVTAGVVLRTKTEGLAYEVAASGATDHDVATAAGVKLYVRPLNGAYSLKAFGAAMNGATDDIEKLEKARDRILSQVGSFTLDATGGVVAISRAFVLFPNGTTRENITLRGHFKAIGDSWAKRVDDVVLNSGTTTGAHPQQFETKDYMLRLSHDYGTAENGKPVNIKMDSLVLDCNERCNGLLVANGEGVDIEAPFIHSFLEAGITFKNNYTAYSTRGTDIFLRAARVYRKKTTTLMAEENATLYTGEEITGYAVYSSGQDLQVLGGTFTARTPIFNERGSAFLSGVHVWCLAGPATVPGASNLARWQNWLAFHSGVVASNLTVDGQTYFDDCVPVITNPNGAVNIQSGQITVREDDTFGGLGAVIVFSALSGAGDALNRCKITEQVEINATQAWNTVGTSNGTQILFLDKCRITAGDLFSASLVKLLKMRVDCFLTLTIAQATDSTSGSGYHKFRWSFAEWSNKDFTPGVTTFAGTRNNEPRNALQATVPVRAAHLKVMRAAATNEATTMTRMKANPPYATRIATDQWDVYWPADVGGDMVLTGWRTTNFDELV